MDMPDEPNGRLSAENVEEFDVWIFDSQDLVASVVPHQAPWRATTEKYELSEQ
jgi:hypothetical protein